MTIQIYRHAIAPKDLDALIRLIEAAGYQAEVINELPDQCNAEDTFLLILYPEESEFYSPMETVFSLGGSIGCDVFGVWPPDSKAQNTLKPADDFGAGVTTWNASRLKHALENPDERWETPQGEDRAEPELPRHKCKK